MSLDLSIRPGDIVRYNGGTEAYCWIPSDPACLEKGRHYTVERVLIHDYHTEIRLVGLKGSFNSSWFDLVEDPPCCDPPR